MGVTGSGCFCTPCPAIADNTKKAMKTAIRTALALSAFALLAPALLLAQNPPTMFPPVRGTHEMVGAANNFEVEAGFRMLTHGGNAVDAAVAATLTATVTELSRFGLGGEMPMLVRMAGKPVVAISGIGFAPAKATVDYYTHRAPESWEDAAHMPPVPMEGIKAAITPGVFDGLILALRQFGTKSFAEVAAPAIEYASDGFVMPDEFGKFLQNYHDIMMTWPASAQFFYPNGAIAKRGERFQEPILAATLRELAAAEKKTRGNRDKKLRAVRDYFYKGSIAHRIADFNAQNGGLISYDDMAGFKATTDEAVTGTYRGYEIHKPGFWTQGPVMIEALNILEGYDLKAMGHNSPEYLHTLIEAVKLAFADRDQYYGDPRFSNIPETVLLSKDYAAERRKLIDPNHASMEHRPGSFGRPSRYAPDVAGRERFGAGHHLRGCSGPLRERRFGDSQRSVAALGDCRRHRHSAHHAAAIFCHDGGTSQSACAGKASARHAQPDAGNEGWATGHGDVDAGRRQSGSGHAAGFAQHRRLRDDRAGGRGSAALHLRAFLQLLRESRIHARPADA